MLKVLLIVGKNIESGGVEAYLLNTLSQINRNDIQIEVLVPGMIISEKITERLRSLGCSFQVLNITQTGIKENCALIGCIKTVISSKRYDVVHVNTTNLRVEAICLILARRENVKVRIAHSHGTLLKASIVKETIRNVFRKIIVNNANEFLACSHAAAEALVGEKNSDKVKIARNGIKVKDYKFNREIRDKIRTLYEWNDRFVIGMIARISPEKNHLFMLCVMKQLVEKENRSLLVVIGTGDASYENQVKEEVGRLGLQANVQFMGEQDNINELLQGIDLHILPSIREALGIVNIEAQAAGLHCICSDRVPKEADITGLVEFISLENGADYWAERILQHDNDYERRDTSETIRKQGYDITSSVQILDKVYHTYVNKLDHSLT